MLSITITPPELFDEVEGVFINPPEINLRLEHSLYAISKWEAEYKKSFFGDGLSDREMTAYEFLYYVKCMSLDDISLDDLEFLTQEDVNAINKYINDPMTATTDSKPPEKGPRKVITSEVIYWQMIQFNIPFECDKWNYNRLSMLIRVCAAKSGPQKEEPMEDLIAKRKALNASRLASSKRPHR